mmetsp:Transcript_15854/g.61946  ORF Transcript_15854/g.61946 Transcript_15854/m.61946 type:complete len:592 (+) Transcript_15854:15-1790(+)
MPVTVPKLRARLHSAKKAVVLSPRLEEEEGDASPWAMLPPELLLYIFEFLFPSADTCRRLSHVCRSWRSTMSATHTWKALYRRWFAGSLAGRSPRQATHAAAVQLAGKLREAGVASDNDPLAVALSPCVSLAAAVAVWAWAAERGHVRVLEQLLAAPHLRKAGLVGVRDSRQRTALYLASRRGHAPATALLLQHGADVEALLPDGTTPLLSAAHHGHADVVRLLVDAGADVQVPRKSGATPLYIAAQEGLVPIVRLLLAAGAEVDTALKAGATPLYIAAQNGHAETVQLLLQHGAQVNVSRGAGTTPLHVACNEGNEAVVECLLLAGVDKLRTRGNSGQDALYIASYHGHLGMVRLLLRHGEAFPALSLAGALVVAAQKGQLRVARQLVRAGADVNMPGPLGVAPLYVAAKSGQARLAAYLLRHGAAHERPRFDGDTPLLVAARRGHTQVCTVLLNAGADANYGPSGELPLLAAVAGGKPDVAALLLEHGARVDCAATFERLPTVQLGDSPLHAACRRASLPLVQLLLAHGASPDAPHHITGETAANVARHLRATSVMRLLAGSGPPLVSTAPLQRLTHRLLRVSRTSSSS